MLPGSSPSRAVRVPLRNGQAHHAAGVPLAWRLRAARLSDRRNRCVHESKAPGPAKNPNPDVLPNASPRWYRTLICRYISSSWMQQIFHWWVSAHFQSYFMPRTLHRCARFTWSLARSSTKGVRFIAASEPCLMSLMGRDSRYRALKLNTHVGIQMIEFTYTNGVLHRSVAGHMHIYFTMVKCVQCTYCRSWG